jgi:hypothetical protein
MNRALFTVLCFFFLPLISFAADVWKSVEEIEVNGNTVTKNIFVGSDVMRTENESESGKNETIIDLPSDRITIINHKIRSYQIIQLSKYIEFAGQLAEEMKGKGHIDPEKVIPQVTFEKLGMSKVEKWDCEEWLVKVDGKPYNKVWVAPELKNLPVIKFKKKFAAIMPESLAKYRSTDAKIEDNFLDAGMIVKAQKIPANKKMPVVTQTVKLVEPSDIKMLNFKIPSDYSDNSASGNSGTQPAEKK